MLSSVKTCRGFTLRTVFLLSSLQMPINVYLALYQPQLQASGKETRYFCRQTRALLPWCLMRCFGFAFVWVYYLRTFPRKHQSRSCPELGDSFWGWMQWWGPCCLCRGLWSSGFWQAPPLHPHCTYTNCQEGGDEAVLLMLSSMLETETLSMSAAEEVCLERGFATSLLGLASVEQVDALDLRAELLRPLQRCHRHVPVEMQTDGNPQS